MYPTEAMRTDVLPNDTYVFEVPGRDLDADTRKRLTQLTKAGQISRQEIVSMVPVLMLDPVLKNKSKCLDMCASPGSKTTQLLELEPKLIVANDFSLKRASILSNRCKNRVRADIISRLIITNHAAQVLPGEVKFDRIVCDVPCTGDGAIRKTPELWRYWQPHLGLELHSRQLQIAMRAARLLDVGGTMAYSTCSMNPIENEAVVWSLLKRWKGELELLDVSDRCPNLKRCPGLLTWKVLNDECEEKNEDRKRFRETMFPPDEDDENRNVLRRCVRLYPHLQNTGGFFVAILRRTKESSNNNEMKPKRKKRRKIESPKPPPRMVPEEVVIKAATQAGLDGVRFANHFKTRLFSFSSTFKKIFALSESASSWLRDNERRCRVVRSGVPLLERSRDGVYEIVQEGVSLLVSFLRPECKVRIPNMTLFLKSGARKENVSLPLGNCVMVDAKDQRAIVARVCVEDIETFEVEEDEDDDDDGDVAQSSSLTLEEKVYQACTSPEALRMTSKQLMDEMFRKFNVRTKQLKEILGGVSVGTFLESRRSSEPVDTSTTISNDEPQHKLRGKLTIKTTRVRVLRPCATWYDRLHADIGASLFKP